MTESIVQAYAVLAESIGSFARNFDFSYKNRRKDLTYTVYDIHNGKVYDILYGKVYDLWGINNTIVSELTKRS